jgi:hypothetical protein
MICSKFGVVWFVGCGENWVDVTLQVGS